MSYLEYDPETTTKANLVDPSVFAERAAGPAQSAREKAFKNLSRLSAEVDRLVEKIRPALGPEVPEGKGESANVTPGGVSDVTASFLDLATQADLIAYRVNNIVSRVEL